MTSRRQILSQGLLGLGGMAVAPNAFSQLLRSQTDPEFVIENGRIRMPQEAVRLFGRALGSGCGR